VVAVLDAAERELGDHAADGAPPVWSNMSVDG
jgi:hypothetical protein